MPERGGGHHCAACNKTVVDMTRLTLLEAVETARVAPVGTCSSYALRDGALVFRASRRTGGSVVISIAAFLAACHSNAPTQESVKAESSALAAPSAFAAPSAVAAPSATLTSSASAPFTPTSPFTAPSPAASTLAAARSSRSTCNVAKLPSSAASSPDHAKGAPGTSPKHADTVLMGY